MKIPFLQLSETGPYATLRQANLLLFGLMPAALLLTRGGAEVIMAVIGLSYLWVTVAERRWNNFAEPLAAILLITWVLLNVVVSPLALDPAQSFSRSLLWLRFVVFFIATARWLIRSRQDLKILVALWSATLALSMLDGYVQLISGTSLSGHARQVNRLTGPLDRPNIGMFTSRIGFPLLAMALMLHANRRQVGRMLATAAFALVAFVFIILSGERTAALLTMASVVLGAGIVAFLVRPLRVYGVLLAATVPVVFWILYHWSDAVHTRVINFWADIDNFWSSPYGEIFRAAFRIWQHFPIAGSGLKGFQDACRTVLPPDMAEGCHPHAHNIYLEWLSESGLIGLICFLSFVIVLAVLVLRLTWTRPDRRLIGAVLCGGLIVTLFPIAATQSFFSNWPAMLTWTALGAIAGIMRVASQDPPGRKP